jgi:two-component system, sensor histidine kinase PdtaS
MESHRRSAGIPELPPQEPLFGEGFCVIKVIFDERDAPVDYRFLEMDPSFVRQIGLTNAQGKTMRELALDH